MRHSHTHIQKDEKYSHNESISKCIMKSVCVYICMLESKPTRERNKNSQLPQQKKNLVDETMNMLEYDRFELRRIKEPLHRNKTNKLYTFFFHAFGIFWPLCITRMWKKKKVYKLLFFVYFIAIGYITIIKWFTFLMYE